MVSGRKAWLLDLFHDPLQTFLSSSKTLHHTEQSMRTHLSMSMLKVQASWDSSRSIFFSLKAALISILLILASLSNYDNRMMSSVL